MPPSVPPIIEQLRNAMNEQSVDGMLECFDPDYHSEQPAHPEREFQGKIHVSENWGPVFSEVDNFQAKILRSIIDGDTVWTEWHWHGTREDETTLEMRGVTILGIENDRIAWGRLDMEPVEKPTET